MAITRVQSAGGIANATVGPSVTATETVSAVFGSNNTAGNVIFVWVFLGQKGAGVSNGSPVLTDSRGNTYTQALAAPPAGNANGAGCFLYYATGIAAGANTITFSYSAIGTSFISCTFECSVVAAEYSGMASPAIQATAHANVVSNSAVSLTVTDSHAASITVAFGTPGADNTGCAVVDVLSGGADYLIAAALSANTLSVPTTTPSGYQTFAEEQNVYDSLGPFSGYHGYLWDSSTPVATAAVNLLLQLSIIT